MKRQNKNLLIGVLSFLCVVQCFYSQELGKADSVKSLRVQLEKTNFYLLEPIYANFALTFPINNEVPKIANEVIVKVSCNGKTKEFRGLTIYLTTGEPQPLPNRKPEELRDLLASRVRPTDAKATSNTVEVANRTAYDSVEEINRVEEFFPQPGKYTVQFEIQGVKSNKIDLTIRKPEGLDGQAFNFLKEYNSALSFDWVWKEKDGASLLEYFVQNYSDSVYGESAIRYLGNVYKSRGDLEKAEKEFLKLQFSSNKPVAMDAQNALAEIEKQKH